MVYIYFNIHQGDSGGPLTKNGVLVGVVSAGSKCNPNVRFITKCNLPFVREVSKKRPF